MNTETNFHRDTSIDTRASDVLRRYRNQIVLGLFIAFAIYVVVLLVADNQLRLETDGILETLARFNWVLLVPIVGLQGLVFFFRWVEWHYYLGVIGARHKMALLDSVLIQVAGFVLVVSPGKAGELLKSALVKAKTNVPIARSTPVVLAERVVDGIAVIVILVLTLLLASETLDLGTYNGVDYDQISRAIIYGSAAVLAAGLIVIQIKPLAYFCLNILNKIPLLGRLYEPLVTFYESSREIFALRHVLPMTFVGVWVYIPSLLCLYLILLGFGLEPGWGLLLRSGFIMGVSSAIGALSFVPNGAGVTEISNVGMLLAFVAPQHPELSPVVAAAAALLQSFFHKWFRVLVGLAVAFIFRNRLLAGNLSGALDELDEYEHKETA